MRRREEEKNIFYECDEVDDDEVKNWNIECIEPERQNIVRMNRIE